MLALAAFTAIASATPTAALASSSDTVTSSAAPDGDAVWRAGVALGTGLVPSRTPLTAFVERQFGPFWIGVTVDGGFTSYASDFAGNRDGSTSVYGDIGDAARVVFNPGDAIEVGVDAALTIGGVRDLSVDDHSLDVTGVAGVDVAHWFSPSFALRLSTPVVFASLAQENAGNQQSSTFGGGIAFAPSVAAVVAF